jgi:DNA polymerase III delta prime subunit
MGCVLAHVAKKEKFDLPEDAATEIVRDSNGNLRKALLVLEALKMQSCVPRFDFQSIVLLTTVSWCTQSRSLWAAVHCEAGLGDVLPQGCGYDRARADATESDGRPYQVL